MDSRLKGDINEQVVAAFLSNYFREVHFQIVDRGIDFICQYPHKRILDLRLNKEISFLFQAKCDYKNKKHIPLSINTFKRNVNSLARSAFFIIYTNGFENSISKNTFSANAPNLTFPTHYLNLYRWLLTYNYKEYLNEKGDEIKIPKDHFVPLTKTANSEFEEEIKEEIRRVNLFIYDLKSSFSKRNIGLTFFEFNFICRNFDLPFFTISKLRKAMKTESISDIDDAIDSLKEEIKTNDLFINIYKKISSDIKHPLDLVEPYTFEIKKFFMLDQLNKFQKNEPFVLCESFNVIDMAVARSLAANFPDFINPCCYVLDSYLYSSHSVETKDICCSFLMLSSMYSAYDEKTIGDKILNLLCSKKNYSFFRQINVNDIDSYRIKHHFFVAYSEITGNNQAANFAAELANKYRSYQITHLQNYGWPWNFEAVKLYSRGTKLTSRRGENLKTYNELMSSIMEIINLNMKYS